jgi:cytochrome c-type biogenesis protein
LLSSITSGVYAWWGPALAFLAGLVSFASPCVFPLVPGYLAFISGGQEKGQRSMVPILLFIAGFSVVFIALGAFSSVFVQIFKSSTGLRIAGVVIIGFGVFMILYAMRLGSPTMYAEKRPLLARAKPGPAGAFPLGMAFAAGWTPCLGPVLGAILTMASMSGGAARATFLLTMYSLGLAVPFFLIGIGVRRLMTSLGWFQRHYDWIVGVSGGLLVVIGVLMASGLWLRYLSPILNRLSKVTTPI